MCHLFNPKLTFSITYNDILLINYITFTGKYLLMFLALGHCNDCPMYTFRKDFYNQYIKENKKRLLLNYLLTWEEIAC